MDELKKKRMLERLVSQASFSFDHFAHTIVLGEFTISIAITEKAIKYTTTTKTHKSVNHEENNKITKFEETESFE